MERKNTRNKRNIKVKTKKVQKNIMSKKTQSRDVPRVRVTKRKREDGEEEMEEEGTSRVITRGFLVLL